WSDTSGTTRQTVGNDKNRARETMILRVGGSRRLTPLMIGCGGQPTEAPTEPSAKQRTRKGPQQSAKQVVARRATSTLVRSPHGTFHKPCHQKRPTRFSRGIQCEMEDRNNSSWFRWLFTGRRAGLGRAIR